VRGGSHHQLRAEAGPDLLGPVHELLTRLWADEPEVPVDCRVRFEIAVAEVAANIAEHGAAAGARHVVLELRSSPDALHAVFEDDGGPVQLPPDHAPLPPDEAERGRGLVMARSAVDSLQHGRDGGTNRWVLRLAV
jgi:serine/threonine-protein kinase RsbW